MSNSTFKLDSSIFNATLYKQLTDVWLPNVDISGGELDESVMKRWFMADAALDSICRDKFAHALEAIGPNHLPEPTAEPFLDEIERVAQESPSDNGSQAAWTALSLTLLLDQMSRNIYRTDDGLRRVYNHYDPIACNLSRTLLSPTSPISRVDLHPQWRNSLAHRMWLYMPLMHSEDVESHKLVDEILAEAKSELEQLEGLKGSNMILEGQFKAEKEHRDILDKFGRYPHRNKALGRVSTEEERNFLEQGGATFGVAQAKKDEL
jgi:uncharacterized protein (DUF924 family)